MLTLTVVKSDTQGSSFCEQGLTLEYTFKDVIMAFIMFIDYSYVVSFVHEVYGYGLVQVVFCEYRV